MMFYDAGVNNTHCFPYDPYLQIQLEYSSPGNNRCSLYLSDGYRSNVTTLRDLLAHKMGVPRHDYMWVLDNWSSDELFQ